MVNWPWAWIKKGETVWTWSFIRLLQLVKFEKYFSVWHWPVFLKVLCTVSGRQIAFVHCRERKLYKKASASGIRVMNKLGHFCRLRKGTEIGEHGMMEERWKFKDKYTLPRCWSHLHCSKILQSIRGSKLSSVMTPSNEKEALMRLNRDNFVLSLLGNAHNTQPEIADYLLFKNFCVSPALAPPVMKKSHAHIDKTRTKELLWEEYVWNGNETLSKLDFICQASYKGNWIELALRYDDLNRKLQALVADSRSLPSLSICLHNISATLTQGLD